MDQLVTWGGFGRIQGVQEAARVVQTVRNLKRTFDAVGESGQAIGNAIRQVQNMAQSFTQTTGTNRSSTGSAANVESTGMFSNSAYKRWYRRIPRNVFRDVRAEPRFSYLENSKGGLESPLNQMRLQVFEEWNYYQVYQAMLRMRNFYEGPQVEPIEVVGGGQAYQENNPNVEQTPGQAIQPTEPYIWRDTTRLLGCIFKFTRETIISNWSTIPARVWLIEYSYKKTGHSIPSNANPTGAMPWGETEPTFSTLWNLGFQYDVPAVNLGTYPAVSNMYGYTYTRSDALRDWLNIEKSIEIHLQPRQTHIHNSTIDMNAFIDMQKLSANPAANENDAGRKRLKLRGLTRGLAIIWHGMLISVAGTADPALGNVELAWVQKITWQGTLQDRIYGKTEVFNYLNPAPGLPQEQINPLTGVVQPVDELNP